MGYSNPTSIRNARNKKPEPAPPVNVSASLSAEWPLKGSDAEELLLASQSLQSKLKSELAKSAPKIELSPEQEEMQEEALQNMGNPQRPEAGRSGVLLRGEDFQCRLCQSGRQGVCNGQEPRPAAGQRRRRFAR